MRTVLIGAVNSTAIALRALQLAGHPPALIVTLDPVLGRKRHSDFVDLAPLADGADVIAVEDCNAPDIVTSITTLRPDFLLVIGWSQIVGAELQSVARNCAIGFHPTALPLHRGRAPLAWTILLGLTTTGSSLFVIDAGVDSGPILAQRTFAVDQRETVETLMTKHMTALSDMLAGLVPQLASGTWSAVPQNDTDATYCAVRRPDDGAIDWKDDAVAIDRLVRATTRPYPGAFTWTKLRRVAIWSALPVHLPHTYHGLPGQIVMYQDGDPVVLCGDGRYLRLTEYETDDGGPLIGQPRFLPPSYEAPAR